MARVYNFSAGPSMLPEAVLKTAQAELLDYHGSGMSVMEMSHRSKWFDEIITNTEAAMRRVLNIPDNYKVGFFQGRQLQQEGSRGGRQVRHGPHCRQQQGQELYLHPRRRGHRL